MIQKTLNIRPAQCFIKKEWGKEEWIYNDSEFCGKILWFKKGGKFSLHYHLIKFEVFRVLSSNFILRFYNTETAELIETEIKPGDIIDIPRGIPHQLECLSEEGAIIEFSTQHFDEDSYRIGKGDSQK